jgi:hypothetical protein
VKAIGPARHRYDTAHFGWVKFEASPESTEEIKKALDGNEKVLRYLLIKTARENTLYGAKILAEEKKDGEKPAEGSKEAKVAAPASQEEIDKSIDKLVI